MSMSFTSESCSMFVNYTCWYDVMDTATSYVTAILKQTHVDADTCTVNATIVTPLACDFVSGNK